MNWRRGLFRLWLVATCLLYLVAFPDYWKGGYPNEPLWLFILAIGLPALIVLGLGWLAFWIGRGFMSENKPTSKE